MRQIKDGAGSADGQPREGGFPIPGVSRRGAVGDAIRGLGALVLLCLLSAPLVAQRPAGDAKGQTESGKDGAPLLLLTQTEIDLGELAKGVTADARFELRNAGNADLHILDVKSGCACTIATYDEVIPPGGVGFVTATLLTETLSGPVGQGVSVMTNDPTSPAAFLLVRAQVVVAVRVLPERAIVLRNQPGELPVRRLIRRSTGSGHGFFNIVGLESSAPWIDARARKVRESAPASDGLPPVEPGDWILELGLSGQPEYGKRREEVKFKTGLERQPVVKLEIHTELLAPVQLAVDRLFLQPRGDAAAETISLTLRKGLDPSALRVDTSPAGLTVQLEPGDGQTLTARFHWAGGRLDNGLCVFRVADERLELPILFERQR